MKNLIVRRGWILEGKVNYGSQSTWLKYQGQHTVIGPVSVLCQSAIFHRFVSLLEVKPIWASFINPKVLLLAGAGLSSLRGRGGKQRSATGRKHSVLVHTFVCECVFVCIYACAHVSDSPFIHLIE